MLEFTNKARKAYASPISRAERRLVRTLVRMVQRGQSQAAFELRHVLDLFMRHSCIAVDRWLAKSASF